MSCSYLPINYTKYEITSRNMVRAWSIQIMVYPSMCRQRYGSDESGNTPHEQNGRDPSARLFSLLFFFCLFTWDFEKNLLFPISYKYDNVNETQYLLYVCHVLSLSVKYVFDFFISRFNLSFHFPSLLFLISPFSFILSPPYLACCTFWICVRVPLYYAHLCW